MKRLLVISYSGFSNQNANGKTLKALLSSWKPQNMMQFYCGNEDPDFTACHYYFHVTDKQLVKACFRKSSRHYFCYSDVEEKTEVPLNMESQKSIFAEKGRMIRFLTKHKYNFVLRTLREYLWLWSPWGKKELTEQISNFSPDAIFYMVGESFALDHIVLKILSHFPVPLILYNAEAYRIIDLKQRAGLEYLYYQKSEQSYAKLNQRANLVIYNCDYLKEHYEKIYEKMAPAMIAYNADKFDVGPYKNNGPAKKIAYFGNLGVGRVDSLIQIAKAVAKIDSNLKIEIYGKTTEENTRKLETESNIDFKGFVGQDVLMCVKEEADILLHAESFDPEIMPKLRFAFSTKIGQCLCAGRCLVSYAPEDMASTQYLIKNNCAVVITDQNLLEEKLRAVICNGKKRIEYAESALKIAKKNHDMKATADFVAQNIGYLIAEGSSYVVR